ncbi:hypothetical protein N9933_03660 [bacterium]|nr:hypothetical protein [bacterium]
MEIKDIKLSSKQMLLDICSMGRFAEQLLNKERGYNRLLQFLINKDYYYDEDTPFPTLKELSAETGIPYIKIRKQIRQIYEDMLLGYREEKPLNFSIAKTTYLFLISGSRRESYAQVAIDNLPVIPRVGKTIELTFFKAYLDTSIFYVESIQHSFSPKGQEILISLEPGDYNLYWHFRKDQAKEEDELSIMDFYDLKKYELKRKLGVGGY